MSAADRLDDVSRLRSAVERQLASGVPVPDGPAALEATLRFTESADEQGLIVALQELGEDDDAVADLVEGYRQLDGADAADQVAAAWNWVADGLEVDEDSGLKLQDVIDALQQRWEDTIDAERWEEHVAAQIDAEPQAFGL